MRLEVFMGPCQRCGRCFPPPTPTRAHDADRLSGRRRTEAGHELRPCPAGLIRRLSMVMVITSVAAVEMRRLRVVGRWPTRSRRS